MSWCLVLTLAASGLVMGALSLFGLTRNGIEPGLWLAIAVGCAFCVGRRAPGRPFLHGLLVGFLCAIANGVVQAAFHSTYLANNPEAAQPLSQIPAGLDARAFVLLVSPAVGAVYGLVVGGLSVLAARWLGKRQGSCCT